MARRNPHLRASDADRDQVASALREHHAQGRLNLEEFEDRLHLAYAARTYGELDAVLADLPADDLYQLPVPAQQSTYPVPRTRGQVVRRRVFWGTMWSVWAFASSVNLVIWLAVSLVATGPVHPWWIWVAGPWGGVLLLTQILTSPRRR